MLEIEQLYRDVEDIRKRLEKLETQELAVSAGAVGTTNLADGAVTSLKIADATISTADLADDAVTNAKLGNMVQSTIKGRASGAGTGDPTDLTATQAATIIAEADTLLEANGSVTGATTNPQAFTRNIIAPWMDSLLLDPTNGSYFNDNSGSIPAGWTQVDAPQATNTNGVYGFWTIIGASGETSWKYRRQTPFTIESLTTNAWKSFWSGPFLMREGLYSADLNYYIGVYRNNAGTPDDNTFVRLNINWDSASSTWRVRGEYKDGTTQTNGTYYTLARLPVQPVGVRIALQNNTNKNMQIYFGNQPFTSIQMPLQGAAVGSGVTWGQVWWQFSMSRGAGADDRILIGGIDYSNDA